MARTLSIIGVVLCLQATAVADCGHFFRKQVVVQQLAGAVPVAVYPPVYYAAGQELQIAALMARIEALEYGGGKELRSQVQAPYQAPLKSPQQAPQQAPLKSSQQAPLSKGELAPLQAPATGALARCARCHTGPEPAAGLVLDGATPISLEAYARWGQIAGQGRNVPTKMQPVLSAMSAQQLGEVNSALLDLVQWPATVVQPPPPGDLQ